AFKDWETNQQKGWKHAYEQVMDQVHPGAIVLLHTVSEDNAEALDKIIKRLKKDGYQFKSVDDLMIKQYFLYDFYLILSSYIFLINECEFLIFLLVSFQCSVWQISFKFLLVKK